MKMQNTKMEFVTFDAQDIIATSGKVTFVSSTHADFFDNTFESWINTGKSEKVYTGDGPYYNLKVNSDATGLSYYILNSAGQEHLDDYVFILNVTGSANKPEGTEITNFVGMGDGSLRRWILDYCESHQ